MWVKQLPITWLHHVKHGPRGSPEGETGLQDEATGDCLGPEPTRPSARGPQAAGHGPGPGTLGCPALGHPGSRGPGLLSLLDHTSPSFIIRK